MLPTGSLNTKKRSAAASAVSLRDEMRSITSSCDTASLQLKDDALIAEADKVLRLVRPTVEQFGHIWMCGNGVGYCLAVEMAYRLVTATSKHESPTRAAVLNSNGAISSTSYSRAGEEDSMASELMTLGRRGDSLWCFASDPASRSLLSVVTSASKSLEIPVIVFTTYPGTPIIRFADAKLRINEPEDSDAPGYCVQWAHHFLATVLCNQLKRIARSSDR